MPNDFLAFLERFGAEWLEFVIVGGLAARRYGSSRLTHDVDIFPELEEGVWRRTGACPRLPKTGERLSDPYQVRRWITEKGMRALTFQKC